MTATMVASRIGNRFCPETNSPTIRCSETLKRGHLNSLIEGRGRRRVEGPVALAFAATCFVDCVEDWPCLSFESSTSKTRVWP